MIRIYRSLYEQDNKTDTTKLIVTYRNFANPPKNMMLGFTLR